MSVDKVLEIAQKYCEEAEVYQLDYISDEISFENGKLKDIESKIQSGISLRIIKDGKVGFAFTKNIINPEEIVNNALNSLKGEIKVDFNLPLTKNVKSVSSYDPSIEELSTSKLVEECKRVSDILISSTKTQINVGAEKNIINIRIINSKGTDLTTKLSNYYLFAYAVFPGSYAGISRLIASKSFREFSKEDFDYITNLYNASKKEVKVKSGKYKTLFLPNTVYVLMWRFIYATNGENIYKNTSPLKNKIGEKIFDSALTIYDDPLNDINPNARSFDDEGVPCKYLTLVENGVLKNFYFDLYYGSKLKRESTGHGYKTSDWGGEIIKVMPSPSLKHLYIRTGDKTLSQMISSMDKGVIIANALGAHSGDIPNGDFSIGLSPGLYVENGEVIGHIKDAMIAGNIYDVLKKVLAIENKTYLSNMGFFPSLLLEDVSLAVK